jgi:hypothetical protein
VSNRPWQCEVRSVDAWIRKNEQRRKQRQEERQRCREREAVLLVMFTLLLLLTYAVTGG